MSSIYYTYVFYNTVGYDGNSTLSAYTLDITPIQFIPDFTSCPLLSGETIISNKKIEWNFGDGTYANTLTASHVYKWPGTYRPKLTIFDNNGRAYDSSYTPNIIIQNFVCDDLGFKDFKRFIYDVPASKIIEPLTVQCQNSWQSYEALSGIYTVNLYVSGAAGEFIDYNSYINDKWSHLRSLSRFYQVQRIGDFDEFIIVDKLDLPSTKIYARINNNNIEQCAETDTGAYFAGTTGSADFYYVDDRTKNYTTRDAPILLMASMDNAKFKDFYSQYSNIFDYVDYPPYGFQNIQPAVLPIIKVRHNPAASISITTNGVDGEGALSSSSFFFSPNSFIDTDIPFVVRFKDNDFYTTKTYPPLYSNSIEDIIPPLTAFSVQIDLVQDNSLSPLTSVKYYSDFSPEIPRSIGGFYKGYFNASASTENVKLTAGIFVEDPVNFPKDSIVGWIAEPQYNYIKRIFKTSFYNYCGGFPDLYLSAYIMDYSTPASTESYAVAVAPSGAGAGEDYRSWVADGRTDRIYKIDIFGAILSAFYLSSFPFLVEDVYNLPAKVVADIDLTSPELSSAAPNSIAIDGNSDIWFSLFDSVSCIKMNTVSGIGIAVAYPEYSNIVVSLSADYNIPELSGFAGENLLLPASLDTDNENNLWVAYTHPASSLLIKYDSNGTIITVVPIPPNISPEELIVDRNKYVWVTALNLLSFATDLTGRNDLVYKFESTGALVSGYPLSGFRLAGNITLDGQQNAYVVSDRDTIIRIDGISRALTYYPAGSAGGNTTNYICSIGGIACDTANYVWTINNVDQKLYYIDTEQTTLTSVDDQDFLALDFPILSTIIPVSAMVEKTFQAYGDWNGARWINKYMVPYTITRYLTGESNVFNVYPKTGKYSVAKINEDFDASEFLNGLRFQESLLDKTVFFNEFLKTIVGGTSAQPYELGKTIYEKIANFVSNNADIDKCNVDKLISFCGELGVQFEEYNYPFPPQLRRLIDILSIKHKILWGDKNTYNLNFDKKGYSNSSIYGINLGPLLSTETSYITSGKPVVAQEIFSNNYILVNNVYLPYLSSNSVVPLSTYAYNWGWGLVAPRSISGTKIGNYYRFFEFISNEENTYHNNTIDWKNPQNTLNPALSSYEEWRKNTGIVENMISYELTKGLRLFTNNTNIVYNN